jgi:hypothetical protein
MTIKDIIIKTNNLLMINAVRIFSKSPNKWIFEIFDENDNQKYTQVIQLKHSVYIISCDCKNSTISGNNSLCVHKWAVLKKLEMSIYGLV